MASLLEHICAQPESDLSLNGNRLVEESRGLVGQDYLLVVNEVSVRVTEFGERQSCLSFVDSVELICALRRLENCKETLPLSFNLVKMDLSESFWNMIREIIAKSAKWDLPRDLVTSKRNSYLYRTARNCLIGAQDNLSVLTLRHVSTDV